MHNSVMEYVCAKVDEYKLYDKEVLELGSRNINGTAREFFNCKYVGIDMIDGMDVDIVCMADNLPFDDESFDVVLCLEMLEHDPTFWETFAEARRVLKWNGYFILTTRGINFPYHEFPGDFWRFTEDAIKWMLNRSLFKEIEVIPDPEQSGVFAIATRG